MFATIFLIRKVTGYWEGRGQEARGPSSSLHQELSVTGHYHYHPGIIGKFTGADLLNWWVTTDGAGHIATRIFLWGTHHYCLQRFFLLLNWRKQGKASLFDALFIGNETYGYLIRNRGAVEAVVIMITRKWRRKEDGLVGQLFIHFKVHIVF